MDEHPDIERRKLEAELRRAEAEQRKLELETSEIERRLKSKWWQGDRFSQYLFASIVSATVLFAWAKGYYEPIASLKTDINKLENERLESLRKLLEARDKDLTGANARLEAERESLQRDRDNLRTGNAKLTEQQENLKLIVEGLKIATEQQREEAGEPFPS
jgi:hypothetical protein